MNKAGKRKLELIEERGPLCEYCKINPAADAHHCLFGRSKRYPQLDVKYNLMLLCPGCHKFASFEMKRVFWEIQVRRYGYKVMRNWIDNLPLINKENFE